MYQVIFIRYFYALRNQFGRMKRILMDKHIFIVDWTSWLGFFIASTKSLSDQLENSFARVQMRI